MVDIVDIEKDRKKAISRFIFHIVSISLLSILAISGIVLLLVLSKLEYQINLIIDLLLAAFYLIFIIFYFFNIFPVVKHYYSLFKGMNNVSLEHRRRLTYLKEIDEKIINNINYRVLQFTYKEGEHEYIDNLYILDNDINFEIGNNYRLDTYHNVIVRYEVLDNATI